MPNFQVPGPASTPRLVREDQYRLMQQQAMQQYQNWQKRYEAGEIDLDTFSKESQNLQATADEQTAAFQSDMQLIQQGQRLVDLGIISPKENAEISWSRMVGKDYAEVMFPEEERGPQREPFTPKEVEDYAETIEPFLKTASIKRKGAFGIDWLKKDIAPSLSRILKAYDGWRTNIGYGSMTFDQQRQVDYEWDLWTADKGWDNWNPKLEAVKTRRAKGPLTRGYGKQFRGTPTGPTEPANPLQTSIAADLSKRQPKQAAQGPKTLTEDVVRALLQEVGGNPAKARQLAKERGYTQ